MRRLVVFSFFIWIWWLATPPAAFAETRLALVIAVQGYQYLPKLQNTIADADLIAAKLRSAGFDVEIEKDVSKTELPNGIRNFGHKIEAAGPDVVALVYYAGHGVQDEKQVNYVVAADAQLKSDIDLPIEALPIDTIRRTLEEAKPKLLFEIFDACRDDPMPSSPSRGMRRGLAPEIDLPPGLLISYSTKPGGVAEDGPPGGNSPFATAFAEELEASDVEIQRMFQLVSRKVLDLTHGEQLPWVEARLLTEDFYFHRGAPSNAPPAHPVTADTLDACEVEYGGAVVTNTADAYEDWLRKCSAHRRHENVMVLLQRLREEALWKRAEAAASVEDKSNQLDFLLTAFPDGVYAQKAKEEIKQITAAPVVASLAAPPHMVSTPPPAQSAPQLAPPTPSEPAPTIPSVVRRFPNTDSPGNDRGTWIANVDIDECESACKSDSGCVGYTYNIQASACFPKNRITEFAPASESAVTGVFTDRAAAPLAPGAITLSVQRYVGKDAPGNDRGRWLNHVATEDDCQRACFSDIGCVGYTYNFRHEVCIRKNWIGNLTQAADAAVTGALLDRSAPPNVGLRTPRFQIFEGQDSFGGDLGAWHRGITQDACKSICVSDTDCAGYTYNRKRSTCILKQAITRL